MLLFSKGKGFIIFAIFTFIFFSFLEFIPSIVCLPLSNAYTHLESPTNFDA